MAKPSQNTSVSWFFLDMAFFHKHQFIAMWKYICHCRFAHICV
ncbi:hypothetical protein CPter91_4496 [Collimonas pratensis]|uniref:Uncharacterized protein n=1 Tax=Collimonas pratensis TaxID=279113 RepID=A0A127Q9T1_9BURK|nr:hypothetical protein CPter91_4496 [Collimonas pratensis]